MLKNKNIICISSIDWDFIWQGHQEIMSTLADSDNRVLFIENTGVRPPTIRDLPRIKKRLSNWRRSVKGLRKESENLYVYSPIILPFPYSRIARYINRHFIVSAIKKWAQSINFSNPIIWTFLPTGIVLDIVDALDATVFIYYCIDNFSASSKLAARIKEAENNVIKKADLVFVTAKSLYDRCAEYNNDVYLFPFGVNLDVYKKIAENITKGPEDIAHLKRPIIGYVGGIHKWVDFDLVRYLALQHKDKSFVFVGPLQEDVGDLKEFPNIHFLGQRKYKELPAYVGQFDICLIPYRITEYTKNVYPTKLNEYLSLGKHVISTAISEVVAYSKRNVDVIYIGRSKEEFSALVDTLATQKTSPSVFDKRSAVAESEGSWRKKIEAMSTLIEERLHAKEKEASANWQYNLLRIYRRSKHKIGMTAVGMLALYLLLFNTPFIWLVGKPLKISSPIEKADAIIVLAGGVGESGKAGQGYEERVQYGVDLFKKGYAPYLIFSSGFKYAFKETEVMKALALALGVPADRIIIEDRAGNTYENVKFSSDILYKNRWNKAIITSSPYNMLRVSLVCRKISPKLYFMYAPIPYSIFFGDQKSVEMKHIAAIIHEYLGVVYYAYKGYI